jgi:protein TonB
MIELAAGERLAAPIPLRRWRILTQRMAWVAAVLLHVALIAFVLLFARHRQLAEQQSPPGVSVVFENGGTSQANAPPEPLRGPNTPAETLPPPPPPPPPQQQTAQTPPEVNLNMPDEPFATVQSAPEPQPVPQRRPEPHPVQRPRPPQKYVVMNNMSYGQNTPTPPMPHASQAMNLSLPQSDAQAATASDFSIKGDVGADWDAELTKWVDEHGYYPQAAVEQNQQGTAEVEFTVDRAGHVTGVHLLQSAGSPFLDQAWFRLFAENQLPPFPAGSKSDHVTVDYTVHYILEP